MDSDGGDGGAGRGFAGDDGALLLQLAHVDGVDVHLGDDLNELIDTISIAHQVAGGVVLGINLRAQSLAIIRQDDLQPLIQVHIHSGDHEVNA